MCYFRAGVIKQSKYLYKGHANFIVRVNVAGF